MRVCGRFRANTPQPEALPTRRAEQGSAPGLASFRGDAGFSRSCTLLSTISWHLRPFWLTKACMSRPPSPGSVGALCGGCYGRCGDGAGRRVVPNEIADELERPVQPFGHVGCDAYQHKLGEPEREREGRQQSWPCPDASSPEAYVSGDASSERRLRGTPRMGAKRHRWQSCGLIRSFSKEAKPRHLGLLSLERACDGL